MTEQERIAQLEELKAENKYLRQRNLELSTDKARLESLVAHLEDTLASTRAGRKKHNASWRGTRDKIERLMREGCGVSEICGRLGISRNTYYRYKKEINNR